MKKEMIGDVPGNVLGMLADLNLKLQNGVITPKQLEMFLKKQHPFEMFLKKQHPFALPDYSLILSNWEKFYQEIFNLKTDFAGVSIPEADNKEFPWFICIPKNFLTETAFSGGESQFKIWKYTNKPLDEVLNLSFGRDSLKDSYIVRCKANYEADEDLENLSAKQIAERNVNTLTLKERLLLGRFVFWKEKKLLDRETITLCAGSRYSDGNVPNANWNRDDDKFQVNWYKLDNSNDNLRSRVEVS